MSKYRLLRRDTALAQYHHEAKSKQLADVTSAGARPWISEQAMTTDSSAVAVQDDATARAKQSGQEPGGVRSWGTMITGTTMDRRHDHREGGLAKTIEEQTAKLPSDTFLWAAGGSIAASLTLKILGRDKDALFVGQWAPTFLILGLYNKLVKQLGSDRTENRL